MADSFGIVRTGPAAHLAQDVAATGLTPRAEDVGAAGLTLTAAEVALISAA